MGRKGASWERGEAKSPNLTVPVCGLQHGRGSAECRCSGLLHDGKISRIQELCTRSEAEIAGPRTTHPPHHGS